ncbi:MAG: LysR substrate-binding domain-containing protein, partial [Burkholderiaceae bacterium]
LGSVFLLPALAACRARWEGVTLELVGESRIASLARREADLAVRIGRPQEPGLAARPLGTLGYGLFARRGYFAQLAEDWRFVGYDDSLRHVPEHRWIDDFAAGRPFTLRSNKLSALHEAARAGLGIAVLPRFLAATAPELDALAGAAPPSRELWLAVHPDVRRSPRVRLIADLVVELCAASAALLAPETAR